MRNELLDMLLAQRDMANAVKNIVRGVWKQIILNESEYCVSRHSTCPFCPFFGGIIKRKSPRYACKSKRDMQLRCVIWTLRVVICLPRQA